MAKPSQNIQPTFTEIKRFESEDEINRSIEKLSRCKQLLDDLWDCQAVWDDPRRGDLEDRIRTTVLEVFGPNSPEYGRSRFHTIWHGRLYANMPQHEFEANFRAGFTHTGVMLKAFVDRIEESRQDLDRDAGARSRSTFEGLDLHPRISGACADLYRDGHYKQAVLEGSIALVNYVKEKSHQHSLDGFRLMTTAFSANSPLLSFNELKDQTDRDEQEGFMHLFMGAVLALRNPRAHALFDDSPELALDYIAFLSMLAKRLDGAKRI